VACITLDAELPKSDPQLICKFLPASALQESGHFFTGTGAVPFIYKF